MVQPHAVSCAVVEGTHGALQQDDAGALFPVWQTRVSPSRCPSSALGPPQVGTPSSAFATPPVPWSQSIFVHVGNQPPEGLGRV